jgi:hypothetical protein
MIDDDDFNWAFPRFQLEPKPLHSLGNPGAFRRRAFVHVEPLPSRMALFLQIRLPRTTQREAAPFSSVVQ